MAPRKSRWTPGGRTFLRWTKRRPKNLTKVYCLNLGFGLIFRFNLPKALRMILQYLLVLLISCSVLLHSNAQSTAIQAGKILNVVSGDYHAETWVIVENGVIKSLETSVDPSEYEEVIDLSAYTLLPGLMDCHTHLTGNWYLGYEEFDDYTLPAATYGIVGVVNARKTLEAGFTTVRDVHSDYFSDVALRDAINKGWVPGAQDVCDRSGTHDHGRPRCHGKLVEPPNGIER